MRSLKELLLLRMGSPRWDDPHWLDRLDPGFHALLPIWAHLEDIPVPRLRGLQRYFWVHAQQARLQLREQLLAHQAKGQRTCLVGGFALACVYPPGMFRPVTDLRIAVEGRPGVCRQARWRGADDDLWRRSLPFEFSGLDTRLPSREDLLLIAILQDSVLSLIDAYFVCRQPLDWELVARQAREWGQTPRLLKSCKELSLTPPLPIGASWQEWGRQLLARIPVPWVQGYLARCRSLWWPFPSF